MSVLGEGLLMLWMRILTSFSFLHQNTLKQSVGTLVQMSSKLPVRDGFSLSRFVIESQT